MSKRLTHNLILLGDAYKYTHWLQIPKNVSFMHAYVEARGSIFEFISYTRPFGLQGFCQDYLEGEVLEEWMIDEAAELLGEVFQTHEYFNEKAFRRLLELYKGRLPITIRAVEEGKRVGLKNVLVTVEAEGEFSWLATWIETMLLRASWYGTSVCTISSYVKDLYKKYADICGAPANPFFLNDFGARGVSSHESAEIGGAAHLVNFLGTDTVEGLRWAKHHYGKCATGGSVFASEHSTTTIYGKEGEINAYRHFLTVAPNDKIVSIVPDSYDYDNAVQNIIGKELKPLILARSAPTVIRPDSGSPISVTLNTLEWLWEEFGGIINDKGLKILNPKIRIIYGDGINLNSINAILHNMIYYGFSIENIIFGMGGKLLQGVDRDTFKFACKLSYAVIDGTPVNIFKDPITDQGKKSKAGLLKLIYEDGKYQTVQRHERPELKDELDIIFKDGNMVKTVTFDQVRKNAES